MDSSKGLLTREVPVSGTATEPRTDPCPASLLQPQGVSRVRQSYCSRSGPSRPGGPALDHTSSASGPPPNLCSRAERARQFKAARENSRRRIGASPRWALLAAATVRVRALLNREFLTGCAPALHCEESGASSPLDLGLVALRASFL